MPSAIQRPLEAGEKRLLHETASRCGARVVWRLCLNGYHGAKPYHSIEYFIGSSKGPKLSRYTPFAARAEWYFHQFSRDVTDPALLGKAPRA